MLYDAFSEGETVIFCPKAPKEVSKFWVRVSKALIEASELTVRVSNVAIEISKYIRSV